MLMNSLILPIGYAESVTRVRFGGTIQGRYSVRFGGWCEVTRIEGACA